ncbi:MAG: alanine--tRNA ligase [Lysobacterales bacterium]
MKTTADIRQDFLEFFRERGHQIVPSSPLVPGNDPTLLFTNAGMVQFKDMFLGVEQRSYKRAVSSQRCVRAGGKHNDLDQVGYTARHHTFFEMLGNFSFGDYFKRDAILWAWELLTKVWQLSADRLWITIYHTDDEAFAIWHEQVGVPTERIIRIGDNKGAPYASDNFWQMADTGPCGPCTEIFFDHGAHIPGGPPGSPEEDGDRFIEIWNIVFMQLDRQNDGTLLPLPAPCVDTGMGLERVAAVLQHVHSNYEIDLFQRLIRAAGEATATADLENKSLRVIADHIRACAFLIVDGVLPSNEGRGYVLRRIIRRALRHGWMLGVRGPFFSRMVAALVETRGAAYPELALQQTHVERVLAAEESRFAETLDQGMRMLDGLIAEHGNIAGDAVFKLYDTYGFPVDLTADIARERGVTVDLDGFERAMTQQRERAREASRFGAGTTLSGEGVRKLVATEFSGYEHHSHNDVQVLGIVRDGALIEVANEGDTVTVILDRSPFYAESGGQMGDQGSLSHDGVRFAVDDTVKLAGQFHGHVGRVLAGQLRTADRVNAHIDAVRRQAIVLNHSATHLLHAALRKVLGTHVQQKGSLVAPDRLRFDFSHFEPIAPAKLALVEELVNQEIRANHPAEIHQKTMQEALDFGALALFGEKYGENVRVLRMGDFSTELCGGTHVGRTGDIGVFKIISESGIASGVRRIEAVSGAGALRWLGERQTMMEEAGRLLDARPEDVAGKLKQLFERQRALERELETHRARASSSALATALDRAQDVGGTRVLAIRMDGLDAKSLREAADQARQKLGDAVVMFASAQPGNKAALVAGVSGKALAHIKAGELLSHVAGQIGGKGGGRPDLAQGGGDDSPQLEGILESIPDWVRSRLPA